MISNPRLHQLYILRSQVDLLISMEELHAAQTPEPCPHPEDQRQDLRTFGDTTPRFRCLRCDETVEGVA
jgi:hypothetical protein